VMSVLAVGGWLSADVLANVRFSHPAIPYADAFIQLPLFLIVAYLVSALQHTRMMQQELTEFIVHDLRSPLTTIRAALKTCALPDMEEHSRERVLNAGGNSLDRLGTMVNALLDVARAEGGRLRAKPAELDVVAVAENAAGQLRPWAEDLGVEVTVTAAEAPRAHADPDLTLRVLTNLLSNAIKYSPAHTTVTVAVAPDDTGGVAVSVEDHGPGVPPAWLKRVFGKFEQVQARKAGAAVGTGLGLAFCQMAVQAQGGRIWMESEPGVRTVVHFTLPSPA